MTKLRKWGSRADRRWTAAVLATYGTACHLGLPGCTRVATTGDHLIPRSIRPDLEHVVSNGRPACLSCNRRRGAGPIRPVLVDARTFFESDPASRMEIRPVSPPGVRKDGTRGARR